SSLVAARIGLSPAAGLLLALVRKLRALCWSAIGLALMTRRQASVTSGSLRRVTVAAMTVMITVIAAGTAGAQEPPASVAGSVSITGPDGQALVVPGVTLTLTCGSTPAQSAAEPRVEISDDQGGFRFADVPVGEACSIVADLQGFRSATQALLLKAGETAAVTLRLGLDTLREEVTVTAKVDADVDARGPTVERISAQMMKAAPIASERFQSALPLIPGVVRGPDGLLNINGARSNQSGLMFNSANGTDPVTGEDALELPIDAVSSVQVRGAAY